MIISKDIDYLMSKAVSFLSNDDLAPKVFPMFFLTALIIAIILLLLYCTRFLRAIGGTSPTYKSDLGELFYRHGYKQMPFLTGVYRLNPYGNIQIDEDRCSGCTLCYKFAQEAFTRSTSPNTRQRLFG